MSEGFHGTNPEAVLDLLRARRRRGPGSDDGRKLALIVEGGGMRGVLSAGSLLAVDVLGYRDAFDEVFACSAGAVNAAYFLSGQGALGITVYFDSINNRRFYNPFRVRRMVDVGFVYDYIVPLVKVLDESAIRAGRTELFISVTDALTGLNVLLNVKEVLEPVSLVLKASSALPVLFNQTVMIGGREYVDGGVSCILPILQAAERGCTDFLILLTRPREHSAADATRVQMALLYAMLGRRYPALMGAFSQAPRRANYDRRIAMGYELISGVSIATVCPTPASLGVGRTTLDRARLVEGARVMARKTADLFGEQSTELDALFEEYRRPPVPSGPGTVEQGA